MHIELELAFTLYCLLCHCFIRLLMKHTTLHVQYCVVRNSAVRSIQPPPGELAGALCRVEGEGACGELMPYISGGIQGNLERDSGEMDQQSDLVERLTHSSSSSPGSSPTTKQGEDRVRVYTLCMFGNGWIKKIFIFIVKCYCYMYSDNVPMLLFHYLVLPPTLSLYVDLPATFTYSC